MRMRVLQFSAQLADEHVDDLNLRFVCVERVQARKQLLLRERSAWRLRERGKQDHFLAGQMDLNSIDPHVPNAHVELQDRVTTPAHNDVAERPLVPARHSPDRCHEFPRIRGAANQVVAAVFQELRAMLVPVHVVWLM